MIQMLRQEACSGQMHDLAHALTQYCLADPLTKKSVSPSYVDQCSPDWCVAWSWYTSPLSGLLSSTRPLPLMSSIQIQRQLKTIGHTECVGRSSSKITKTLMCHRQVLCKGGESPFRRESLMGRCYIYPVGPNGTMTTSTTLDKPFLSLEDMTGFVVFEVQGKVPDFQITGNRGLSPNYAVCMWHPGRHSSHLFITLWILQLLRHAGNLVRYTACE